MPASYKVYVDWTGNGTFTDAGDDVTSRVLDSRSPVTFRYGRDQQRSLSPIAPADGQFVLDNTSRDYSPENTASPLNGLVVPARDVQITADGTPLLRAQFDDFTVVPGTDGKYVTVDLIDALGALRGAKITTGLYQGLRTGEAAAILLDAVGVPVTARDLDVGATVMPYWWLDNDDAFDALLDLVSSEGPPSLVTVDPANRIVFRDRHHRLQRTASTTVQSTWRSSDPEPSISDPTDYNHGWKEIVNSVTFQLDQRAVASEQTAVWSSQGLTGVASGDTLLIVAQGTNPFINAVTPVQDLDYMLVSGTVEVSLFATSGASATISVKAIGGPAVIQDLQLRGNAVNTVNTVQFTAEDLASIDKYGRRSLPDIRAPKWASPGDAKAIAQITLTQRSERLPTISVTMRAGSNAIRLAQQVNRDLSDRMHVVESHTGLDADCFIEQIAHSIGEGGLDHVTTFGLEKIPAPITAAFVLGSATAGVLGTSRLGRRAWTDPATMFVLGSVTNGVLGTNVLTP